MAITHAETTYSAIQVHLADNGSFDYKDKEDSYTISKCKSMFSLTHMCMKAEKHQR